MNKKNKKIKMPKEHKVASTPIIMQMEAVECGAASLSMILAYYNKWVPLEQVRTDCGVSRDGSNAKNIYKAALSYGLNVKAYRYEVQEIIEKGSFPCIIHWAYNHFVVLNGFKGNNAIISDPARGKVKISMEEFDYNFTGICLMFEPGETFQPGGNKKSVLEFAKKRLKGTKSSFLLVMIIAAVSAVLGVILPIFARIFMDIMLSGNGRDYIVMFIVSLSVVTFIQLVAVWIKCVYMLKIQGKFAIASNAEFMWHVLRLPLEFFSQRMAGDIVTRQKANQDIVSSLIKTFAPLLLNFVMMIFYLTVMLRYNPLLTLIGVISVMINIIIAGIITNKRINITRIMMRDKGNLYGMTFTGIEMIETIKTSGAESGFFEKWSGLQASVNTQQVEYTKLNQYLGTVPLIVSSLSDIIILVTGVLLVIRGEFTIGMILAFQGFTTLFKEPVQMLISSTQNIQEMKTDMERIEDVLEYPTDVECSNADISDNIIYDKLDGSVELKNITFGYSKLDEPLIKDFSLSVKQGERVAFVGLSGCGKSTLSKLISGLYKPWEGEILFGGRRIEEINHHVFTGSLAVVDQDIILFEDTIANNIKMWDSSIEDYEMILAARDAHIHEDIMNRNEGYQYHILEGGKDFSGGQRQRLEIARVLAQDPTIIIMDEATSALDARTEYDVMKSIKDRGITCIVIAHRLSAIRDCDRIIVIDKGIIAEMGTHQELMKKNGIYKELVTNE